MIWVQFPLGPPFINAPYFRKEGTMNWRNLLLDQSYQPVEIITFQKAIKLLLKGKAEIVEEDEKLFRTERTSAKLPLVLRLIKSFRRRKEVKFSRYNIFYRDNWTCQYCGDMKKSQDLTFDHVTPVCQGGTKNWENIVAACVRCNHKKHGRTPEQARMRLLR